LRAGQANYPWTWLRTSQVIDDQNSRSPITYRSLIQSSVITTDHFRKTQTLNQNKYVSKH